MAVGLVVAVTDRAWFDNLRHQPRLEEVNFWSPSPTNFKALEPGELFLFKLHAPHNFIVGAGVFAHANILPWSLAWEAFKEANGASSAVEMRSQIASYRRGYSLDEPDFSIGCRILTQPMFFDEADWIAAPSDWKPNIVKFRRYSTSEPIGLSLWEQVSERFPRTHIGSLMEPSARFGEAHLIRPRLGQGAFRVLVTDIYRRRCAVTLERTLPALEAAHIRPYAEDGRHEGSNGLLLRRDIHSLFDSGYVTVTPQLKFEVSRRIREEFENGRHYYALHGRDIARPDDPSQRPDPGVLAWHNEHCFKG